MSATSQPNDGDRSNHATDANSKLEQYYTYELASLVNVWAKPDLELFGYREWFPSATNAQFNQSHR